MNFYHLDNRFLLMFIVLVCWSFQQTNHYYPSGLIEEDAQYKTLPQQAAFDGAKFDETPLSVNLSSYCPEVGHQGTIHSCVGWAVGYGALTIERAILNNWQDKQQITESANSALFVYNQIKPNDCNGGAKLSDGVQFVMNNGDCLAKDFDIDINNCKKEPESVLQTVAMDYAIDDFMTLFSPDAADKFKILKIKKALAQKKPVIVGFNINTDFYKLKNAQYWWTDNDAATPVGGHAAVIVGYDDRKEAFLLFNSWGKSWGNKGYIWIKYDHFSPLCRYAYILHLNPSDQKNKHQKRANSLSINTSKTETDLAGQIEFKTLKKGKFETIEVQFEGAYYSTKQAAWDLGQMFQISVATKSAQEYLYVFSKDAKNKVQLHFPKSSAYSEQMDSPLILYENSTLFIPNENSALMLTESGSEYLCVLFSNQKIEDIEQICTQLHYQTKDFQDLLFQVLGDRCVAPKLLNYFPESIGFEARVNKRQIVPLILKIEGKKE